MIGKFPSLGLVDWDQRRKDLSMGQRPWGSSDVDRILKGNDAFVTSKRGAEFLRNRQPQDRALPLGAGLLEDRDFFNPMPGYVGRLGLSQMRRRAITGRTIGHQYMFRPDSMRPGYGWMGGAK